MTLFDRIEKLERIGLDILELQYQAQRLRLTLEIAFRPDQPRVPAGSPDGGEWTLDDAAVEPAAFDPSRQYTVNLEEEDRLGGHAFRDHVGKSDEELIQEIWQPRLRRLVKLYGGIAQGSFSTLADADNLVNRILEENRPAVDQVVSGEQDQATLEKRFGYHTGKEAAWRDPDGVPYIRPTYYVRVIIRYAPGAQRGYRVITAFPFNADRIN